MLEGGILTHIWTWFFRDLFSRVFPLGKERYAGLANNQSSPANVEGLKFDRRFVSCVFVEYCVQRVTTGGSAIEKIEAGLFVLTYNPTSDDWNFHSINADSPDNSGVDFTVTSTGQVQYTSTNEGGTASISRIFYRARVMEGKSSQYSLLREA
jgi:hypothetical protein